MGKPGAIWLLALTAVVAVAVGLLHAHGSTLSAIRAWPYPAPNVLQPWPAWLPPSMRWLAASTDENYSVSACSVLHAGVQYGCMCQRRMCALVHELLTWAGPLHCRRRRWPSRLHHWQEVKSFQPAGCRALWMTAVRTLGRVGLVTFGRSKLTVLVHLGCYRQLHL